MKQLNCGNISGEMNTYFEISAYLWFGVEAPLRKAIEILGWEESQLKNIFRLEGTDTTFPLFLTFLGGSPWLKAFPPIYTTALNNVFIT